MMPLYKNFIATINVEVFAKGKQGEKFIVIAQLHHNFTMVVIM